MSDELRDKVAKAIQHADYECNPTWGGDDDWEQIADYKRNDYRRMAQAAIDVLQLTEQTRTVAKKHGKSMRDREKQVSWRTPWVDRLGPGIVGPPKDPDVVEYTITMHRSQLIPGGHGAMIAYSDDHPGKQFLIIPQQEEQQ